MKRKLIFAASVIMASSLMSVCAFAADVNIVIDGNTVASDTEPQITAEGRTIVPLRVISEELGATVDWDAENKSVTAQKGDSTLKLAIGENVMTVDGSEIELDSPAQIINSRTMVPLRAISESFGCEVEWDGETKTVIINTNAEETPEDLPTETKEETYKSKDGWSVKYNSALVNVNENDDAVSFVYTGESAGTNMITISYIKDKSPEEVLGEATADWDGEKTLRTEGYFAGENWAFFRDLISEGGSGLDRHFIAAEYNGGVILIEGVSHTDPDDEEYTVSDTMANILDSMEFDNYQPQKEYDYVPGVYTQSYTDEIGGEKVETTNTVTLNKDHTAVISIQDEVEGLWTSTGIRLDNKTFYEYTIEGEKLYINFDGEWSEFIKETDEKSN